MAKVYATKQAAESAVAAVVRAVEKAGGEPYNRSVWGDEEGYHYCLDVWHRGWIAHISSRICTVLSSDPLVALRGGAVEIDRRLVYTWIGWRTV